MKKKSEYLLKFEGYYTNMLHIPAKGRDTGVPVFKNSEGVLEPTTEKDYTVPEYFTEGVWKSFQYKDIMIVIHSDSSIFCSFHEINAGVDYFSVLEKKRPIWRWLLIGGKGSGSCFHQDPNFTSAWNTSIYGVFRTKHSTYSL